MNTQQLTRLAPLELASGGGPRARHVTERECRGRGMLQRGRAAGAACYKGGGPRARHVTERQGAALTAAVRKEGESVEWYQANATVPGRFTHPFR